MIEKVKSHPILAALVVLVIIIVVLFFWLQIKSCQKENLEQDATLQEYQEHRVSTERHVDATLDTKSTDVKCLIGMGLWE